MPAYRIVYVQDDIGRAETLTAGFTSRADAVATLAARGLRVLHIAEQRAREAAGDPIVVPMAAAAVAEPARAPAFSPFGYAAVR